MAFHIAVSGGDHRLHILVIPTLQLDPHVGFLVILGDQMKQVILNLIKNSLEAMPEGGEITIRTRHTPEDAWAILEFEDTGPGIDAKDPNSVFTPFFSTKTDRPTSMGLGLSISYRTIQRIGGTMRVENLAERGCRFHIALPRALDGV